MPTRDEIIQRMRKALGAVPAHQRLSYSVFLRDTAKLFLAEEPPLREAEQIGNDEADRYYITDPQANAFVEAFWYLLSMGIILPLPNGNQAGNLNHLMMTTIGREWAQEQGPSPEDQTGYLAALRGQVGTLDPIIFEYVKEAVAAYSRQIYFASAVMIGAASEKAVYLLMEALINSAKHAVTKKSGVKLMEERKLPAMFSYLRTSLTEAKKVMPYAVHEGSDAHLISLLEAIRVQRNDAVHPMAGRVTPQTVRLSLASFPGACKKTYDLIQWFQANSF